MELRQLRYFHAVAAEGNLTKAAHRLYLSAPSLSQQIRLLEKELGAPLFDRTTAGMTLTAAGRALLPEAQAALDAAGRARHAVAAARDDQAVLRIGASACVPVNLARRMRDGSSANIQFRDGSTADQCARLTAGELDIGLVTTPFPATGLDSTPVWRDHMVVVMHRDHPLAHREVLDYADLAGQDMMLFRREAGPGHYDQILETCRRNGWVPRLRPESVYPSIYQTQLGCGDPVVSLKAGWIPNEDPFLVRRPIAGDAPTVTLSAAWRAGRRDAPLLEVVAALREHRP